MKNKILTLMGFASKAGKLSYGFDATLLSIKSKKSKLVVMSDEISEKSRKEMQFYSQKYNIDFILLEGMDIQTVSEAVGRKCGIISVNEKGFAQAILKNYKTLDCHN